MNPKLLRRRLVSAVVVGAFAGIYYYTHAPLPRIRLKDGTEIRVLKVAYGTGANHEHEFTHRSELKRRLVGLLPQGWQSHFAPPLSPPPPYPLYPEPMISIWWTYNPPAGTGDPAAVVTGILQISNENILPRKWLQSTVAQGTGDVTPSSIAWTVIAGPPSFLSFQRPPVPAKTLTVNFILNSEPVTFTVPIPAPSE